MASSEPMDPEHEPMDPEHEPMDPEHDQPYENELTKLMEEDATTNLESIIRNGNCFYRAVAQYLFLDQERHRNVRQDIMNFMSEREDIYQPFTVYNHNGNYRSFLRHHRQDGELADDGIVQATADCFGFSIYVSIDGNSGAPQIVRARNDQGAERWLHLRSVENHYEIISDSFQEDVKPQHALDLRDNYSLNTRESLGSADEPSASEPGIVNILKEREREPPSAQGDEISNIHADPLIMCLLLCPSYKLDINDHGWIPKYNTVAKKFGYTTITKSSDLSQLEKYKPLLDLSDSEITFSADARRNTCFLKAAESYDFVEIFLNLGDKENIANYCRSPNYRKSKGEVCYCLSPNQILKFVERLGEDIFTHSAFQDQSVKEVAFQKVGIPMQIIMRGDKSIQNFIQNLRRGKQKIYHASGMIIGCAGSGKTTLLKRLQGTSVEEVKQTTLSTRGVDIFTDVFDVTNTLQVSKSDRAPRFRMTVDKPAHNDNQTSDKLQSDQLKDRGDMENKQTQDAISPQSSEPNNSDEVSEVDDSTTGLEARASSTHQQLIEVSSIIPVSQRLTKDDEIHLARKISMTDFAGQCAYYASHQIFLSPRAFFLLVLNMKKKLDDDVDEIVCSQKGSVYGKWKCGDYVEFWLKSVHQYSGGKAPVLLVATHCENTTDEERGEYFANLWDKLTTKDESLLKHLSAEGEFSVSFDESDDTEIENIKSSIVETVKKLDHWGQDLPQSWVLFETFLLEEKKKEKKILKRDEVMDFNKALNGDIQLNDDDIGVMLQFFHDIREILYFDQGDLKDVIILDIQWLSDAFKHIITDKNHAKKDLRVHATDWKTFNRSGVLEWKLLHGIWNIHPGNYISHKKEIMLYMEKLGLLAPLADAEEKWYIPSMNKIPFEKQELLIYPSSSILCFKFDTLPVGIFHRLVALCIQVPFKILACGSDKQCIYQTAAIFIHDDHHFVIGMTESAIQLQAFVVGGDVDPRCCHQIRQKVESILHTCSNTFQSNFRFSLGYKCKSSGFCDEKESKVIPEEEFTTASFTCPGCPFEKKHKIEKNAIIKYWEQTTQSSSSSEMSTEQRAGGGGGGEKFRKPVEGGYKYKVGDIIHKNNLKDSIGCIRVKSGDREVCGTGFRVGERHVLTAYHVVQEVFKNLWGIVNKKIKQQSTDDTPGDGEWSLTDLAIRLELDSQTREYFKTIGKRMVSDVCTITFGYVDDKNGTTFSFSYDAPFISTKHDVAILELLTEESNNFIPHPLSLAAVYTSIGHLFVLGHPAGGELIIDPMCQILSDEELGRSIKKGIKLFTSLDEVHSDVEKDYSKCKISQNEVFFHCSKSTTHGASGSPLIQIPKDEKPEVIGVLLTGYPKLYYNKYCQNEDVDIHPDVLIESGVSMEMVKKLLDEHGLKELADALFRECK